MSWQSTLINLVLRLQKRSLKGTNYGEARAILDKVYARSAASDTLPANAASQPETLAGVPCEWVTMGPAESSHGVLVYFHGGGFMTGSPAASRDLAWRLSNSRCPSRARASASRRGPT